MKLLVFLFFINYVRSDATLTSRTHPLAECEEDFCCKFSQNGSKGMVLVLIPIRRKNKYLI